MIDGDLFGGGFAWQDEAVSQIDATPAATPFSTPTGGEAGAIEPPVASVADVANVSAGASGPVVSHHSVASSPTVPATPKNAVFCGIEAPSSGGVAAVASVAKWREGVATLSNGRAPDGVEWRDWKALISDARTLVTNWGDDLAAAGWSVLDVFGVNRDPRHRRLDRIGLVAFLSGRPVDSVDHASATVRGKNGDITRYRRTLRGPGAIPIWNLFREGQP